MNAEGEPALTAETARGAMDAAAAAARPYPGGYEGRGIVIPGGGKKYFPCAWVSIRLLRDLGCSLPVELWHLGPEEMDDEMRSLVEPLGVRCVDAWGVRRRHPVRSLRGWEVKPYAIQHSRFREVLLLDADNVAVSDPSYLFDAPPYLEHGAAFWPDPTHLAPELAVWRLTGVAYRREREFESGQVLVDKARCWRELCLTGWMNQHSDFWYRHVYGDKDTFHFAWRRLGTEYAMPASDPAYVRHTICQHDFSGRRVFQHRVADKWRGDGLNALIGGFRHADRCRRYQEELLARWRGRPNRPHDHAAADPGTRAAAAALCGRAWVYARDGHAPRRMTFGLDGSVGDGRGRMEEGWHLRVGRFATVLAVTGVRGVACLLAGRPDGWRGRWRTKPDRRVTLLPAGAA